MWATIAETARVLGVSASTIRRHIQWDTDTRGHLTIGGAAVIRTQPGGAARVSLATLTREVTR